MRTETETYTRNKGFCDFCRKSDKKVRIYKLLSGIQVCLCEGCRYLKDKPPKKKKVSVSEIPENDMSTIHRGLADAGAGRTSAVRLDSPSSP